MAIKEKIKAGLEQYRTQFPGARGVVIRSLDAWADKIPSVGAIVVNAAIEELLDEGAVFVTHDGRVK